MNKTHYLGLVLGGLIMATGMSAMAAGLDSEKEQISYTIGVQIGQDFKNKGLDIDVKALSQAIDDVLKGKEPQLSRQQMTQAIQALQRQQNEQAARVAEQNKKAGEEFLAANKNKPGVKTLGSGVQYKVINKGSGPSPKLSDQVVAHYRGTLIDGTEFDSSYRRGQPATFALGQVIKGWQEALPMMKKGAKWEIYIPANLAYGQRGAGGSIGPNETLIFEIELIDIK